MEIRYASSPEDVKFYTTEKLRKEFLMEDLFLKDEIVMVYSHNDRMITGSAVPVNGELSLATGDELRAEYFLQRREMGIINIGGKGKVVTEDKEYILNNRDGLYLGMGTKKISFLSDDPKNPAEFYINSAPAHKTYKSVLIKLEGTEDEDSVLIKDENKVEMGSLEGSNHRVINKYILPGQVESCQLVMGMTGLKEGSVWNTMPCHTHERRMEVYLYFDLKEDDLVMHYMGRPEETRHLAVRNKNAVISPSWSIHAGSGTSSYTFIWGMVGENQEFGDMDHVSMKDIK